MLSIRADSKFGDTWSTQFLASLLIGLFVTNCCLFVLGYFLEPFYPQYGPFKFLFITTSACFPMAVGYFSRWNSQKATNNASFVVLLAAVVFAFVASGHPIHYLGSLTNGSSKETRWSGQLINEIESNPERVVVCLDTSTENDFDYESYLCSRVAVGLQGVNDSEYMMWVGANLCLNDSSLFESDLFDDDFYKRLTILVTDSDRYTSGGSCQGKGWGGDQYEMGWLSDTNWSLVRVVGYDGKEVLTP